MVRLLSGLWSWLRDGVEEMNGVYMHNSWAG